MAPHSDTASAEIPSASPAQCALNQADHPAEPGGAFRPGRAARLDCGARLAPFQIAYQTYGTLNADRSQRDPGLPCADRRPACRQHPPGHRQARLVDATWSGPGKPIDTDRFFVICANVLGGCMGTTGPASTNPATGEPYGLDLPVITIRDMVRAQAMLLDHLGIETLFACSAARWAACRCCNGRRPIPSASSAALPIATGARHSAQNIAFHEVGRQAIMADPDWRGGAISTAGNEPAKGPRGRAHGRAHHLSVRSGAAPQVRAQPAGPRQADLRLRRRLPGRESICATRARPSSTASTPTPTSTSRGRWTISTSPPSTAACSPTPSSGTRTRFCVVSFTSDWLFPTVENKRDRACANAARRQRQLRRDRDRQGPRRLPARRAGAVRHDPRLPRRGRRGRGGLA